MNKNTKEIILYQNETRTVKDGQDWRGLQTKNFNKLSKFRDSRKILTN